MKTFLLSVSMSLSLSACQGSQLDLRYQDQSQGQQGGLESVSNLPEAKDILSSESTLIVDTDMDPFSGYPIDPEFVKAASYERQSLAAQKDSLSYKLNILNSSLTHLQSLSPEDLESIQQIGLDLQLISELEDSAKTLAQITTNQRDDLELIVKTEIGKLSSQELLWRSEVHGLEAALGAIDLAIEQNELAHDFARNLLQGKSGGAKELLKIDLDLLIGSKQMILKQHISMTLLRIEDLNKQQAQYTNDMLEASIKWGMNSQADMAQAETNEPLPTEQELTLDIAALTLDFFSNFTDSQSQALEANLTMIDELTAWQVLKESETTSLQLWGGVFAGVKLIAQGVITAVKGVVIGASQVAAGAIQIAKSAVAATVITAKKLIGTAAAAVVYAGALVKHAIDHSLYKAYKVTKVALEHAKYMLHQAVAVAISLKKAILKKVTTLGILVAQTGALFIALKHAYIDHLTKHKLAFFDAMKEKLKTVHQVVNDLIYACLEGYKNYSEAQYQLIESYVQQKIDLIHQYHRAREELVTKYTEQLMAHCQNASDEAGQEAPEGYQADKTSNASWTAHDQAIETQRLALISSDENSLIQAEENLEQQLSQDLAAIDTAIFEALATP